jgi:hypothetical protein
VALPSRRAKLFLWANSGPQKWRYAALYTYEGAGEMAGSTNNLPWAKA